LAWVALVCSAAGVGIFGLVLASRIVGTIVLLMAVATAVWSLAGLRQHVAGLHAGRSSGPEPFVGAPEIADPARGSGWNFAPPPGPRLNSLSRLAAVLLCVLGAPSIVVLMIRLATGGHISAGLMVQVVFTVLLFVTIVRCVTVGRPARWR
jgi:hypothetical protein